MGRSKSDSTEHLLNYYQKTNSMSNINRDFTLLNNEDIINFRKEGEVVIEPFSPENLGNTSYDITLGPNFYREQEPKDKIHNMFSKSSTNEYWGEAQVAKPYGYYQENGGYKGQKVEFENIREDDQIIFLEPGECILAHTMEFIGGRTQVTTMLKSRSSVGRNNITICSCAGWGDVGYYGRYTLEIRNISHKHSTFLVVGKRVGQIVFLKCKKVTDETKYSKKGKYQMTDDLEELMNSWVPEMMLPKMYKDYEVV